MEFSKSLEKSEIFFGILSLFELYVRVYIMKAIAETEYEGGMRMTDQEFVEHMKRSPEECMKAVFDEYCNYVYIIAATKLRNCGTTEDIEECVSDVFTEVFKKADDLGDREGDNPRRQDRNGNLPDPGGAWCLSL